MLIGIDTGGTFTDAVLLDEKKGIVALSKAPTTQHDLTVGIRNSVSGLLKKTSPNVQLVSLSSTLATNAVIEGKGRAAGLILIGYDDDILESELFTSVGEENTFFRVDGGHLISGEEKRPLDKQKIQEFVKENKDRVSAFAVSGYFGVRNPEHELEARSIIRGITPLPVTCGHELTSSLDAPKRALTTLLNARLIPLLYDLIYSVKNVLKEFGIHAPLMIVKGDGSLISSHTALDVPVETILSGPAASVAGARYLTEEKDALIIDMGGTTSDMALLRNGDPVVSENNPDIGGFHPMIDAIDTFTKGIGGDSFVRVTADRHISVGPARVLPLSCLGKIHPEIITPLTSSFDHIKAAGLPLFIYKDTQNSPDTNIPEYCLRILDLLGKGPLFTPDIMNKSPRPSAEEQCIRFLLRNDMVRAASFTPTDAMVVLGRYNTGSKEAAVEGAEFLAKRGGMDAAGLSRKTSDQTSQDLARALIECILRYEAPGKNIPEHTVDSLFIKRATEEGGNTLLSCRILLACPVIALGAPAGTYIPHVASMLDADVIVPEYSEVANAIGAVTGTISQKSRAVIKQIHGGTSYRVHTRRGVHVFDDYEQAERHAIDISKKYASEKAVAAGAGAVEIKLNKHTLQAGDAADGNNKTIIETEITATAVGRPRLAPTEEYGGHGA